MFKYIQKKRAEKAKQKAEILTNIEKAEKAEEARREQEKNRIVLTVPDASIKNILVLYDAYRDDEYNKNVNRYLFWKKIESALPETKEGNWYIEVEGSDVIKIKQIFSDSSWNTDYRDSYWDVVNKKLG